jgi:hypothetical protein
VWSRRVGGESRRLDFSERGVGFSRAETANDDAVAWNPCVRLRFSVRGLTRRCLHS